MQPADGAEVLHNGVRVQNSTWLRSGDVVNLGAARLRIAENDSERIVEVDDGSSGNITAPPDHHCQRAAAGTERRRRGANRSDSLSRFRGGAADTSHLAEPGATRARCGRSRGGGRAVVHLHGDVREHAHRPDAANVRVSGGLPAVRLGDRLLLRPGDYRVRAELAGYTPAELQTKVTQAPNQQFALTLAKLPGRLRIEVPAAARVTVDGKEAGNAPGEFELDGRAPQRGDCGRALSAV